MGDTAYNSPTLIPVPNLERSLSARRVCGLAPTSMRGRAIVWPDAANAIKDEWRLLPYFHRDLNLLYHAQ